MIKYSEEKQLRGGKKGSFHVTVPNYNPSLWRDQDRAFKELIIITVKIREKWSLTSLCSAIFFCSYTVQGIPLREWYHPHGKESFHISQLRQSPKTCPQANLMQVIFQGNSLQVIPGCVQLTISANHCTSKIL